MYQRPPTIRDPLSVDEQMELEHHLLFGCFFPGAKITQAERENVLRMAATLSFYRDLLQKLNCIPDASLPKRVVINGVCYLEVPPPVAT